jgi:hypothetical protein
MPDATDLAVLLHNLSSDKTWPWIIAVISAFLVAPVIIKVLCTPERTPVPLDLNPHDTRRSR